MKRNIFLNAYLKNKKSPMFWEDFERLVIRGGYKPFIREGKIDYQKEEDFKPTEGNIKSHIFISNGE